MNPTNHEYLPLIFMDAFVRAVPRPDLPETRHNGKLTVESRVVVLSMTSMYLGVASGVSPARERISDVSHHPEKDKFEVCIFYKLNL